MDHATPPLSVGNSVYRVVMPSPCSTGETLDPPLLTVVPNKALNHFWHVRSRTIFAWNMVLFSSPPVQGRNPTAFSDWGTCDMSAGWSFLLLLVLLLLHDLFLLLCFLSSFFCNWYTDNDARSSTRSTCKHTAPKAGDCLIHILLPAGGAPCQQHCPTSPWPPSLSFCADGHLPASHAAAAFLLPPPASSVLPPAGAQSRPLFFSSLCWASLLLLLLVFLFAISSSLQGHGHEVAYTRTGASQGKVDSQ
jgi:hypothetical protein